MRILALDHGTVRIGVAVSDELKMLAHPVEHIPADPFPDFLERLKVLIREKEVELMVVGMPRNMDGSYGEAAAKVRAFVTVLRETVQVPIRTWDERLTTVQAQRGMRQGGRKGGDARDRIDAAAAAVLLQGYLDSIAT
jgi:putative Holliday junction resolvase